MLGFRGNLAIFRFSPALCARFYGGPKAFLVAEFFHPFASVQTAIEAGLESN